MKELGKWGVSLILYLLMVALSPLILLGGVLWAFAWYVVIEPTASIYALMWRKREKRNPY